MKFSAKVARGVFAGIIYIVLYANSLYATDVPQFQMRYTTNMMSILSPFSMGEVVWRMRCGGAKFVRKD
jgi:hypothetical protein